MNYYLGLKRLFEQEFPWLLISIEFGYSNIADIVTNLTTEKYIIIIDEVLSEPVLKSCYVNTSITIDVIYWLRKNWNDILKAKRVRDKIVKLLDRKSKLYNGTDLLYTWDIRRTGNGRSWHDSKLDIWYHTSEFDLSYYTDCELWCNVL